MASASRFHGVLTALVTPFTPDGAVDEAAFRALVRRQLDAGVHGLVPCGTTGEAPTLSIPEHLDVIRWTVEEASGQVPVLAGIGSNNTATAIATGKRAESVGVDGVLVTAPYYNKPSSEGLFRHFRAVADALSVEVCVYDVPGRTAVKVTPETLARIAAHPRVTCVKDATGDLVNAVDNRRLCGADFVALSGDDFTLLPFWAVGGHGCISVLSNLVPERVVGLFETVEAGDYAKARQDFTAMIPLIRALFVESNPVPVKAALAHIGLCSPTVRLPLAPLSAASHAAVVDALSLQGLGASA